MTYTANMDQIMPEATDIPTNLVKYFATNFNPDISATLMGSLVYQAAFHNDVDYIKKLHAAGVNMNAAANIEYRGMRSPLHVAAASGALKAVELLLHYGASVHARDENDETPLFVAVKARNVEIVEKIKKAGGELHLDSTKIDAEICRSVISEEIDSITAWHTAGVNLSSVMFNGETALHLAASKGILSIGKTLLDLGANPSAKDIHGRLPVDVARENIGKEKRHNFEELIDALDQKMHTGSGKFLHHG